MARKNYTLVIPAYGEFPLTARPAKEIRIPEAATSVYDPNAIIEGVMKKDDVGRLAELMNTFYETTMMDNIYFYIREEDEEKREEKG